jgi:hypothetical protein
MLGLVQEAGELLVVQQAWALLLQLHTVGFQSWPAQPGVADDGNTIGSIGQLLVPLDAEPLQKIGPQVMGTRVSLLASYPAHIRCYLKHTSSGWGGLPHAQSHVGYYSNPMTRSNTQRVTVCWLSCYRLPESQYNLTCGRTFVRKLHQYAHCSKSSPTCCHLVAVPG